MDFSRFKTGFFSMEIGIDDKIPTYAGGLGILAGDALKSCSDLKLPVIGVTLLYKKGYFNQKIDKYGNQTQEPQEWDYKKILKKLDNKISLKIAGQDIKVSCWLYELEGMTEKKQPVLFLDPDLEENPEYFRNICKSLYQGGHRERIIQEMILGIGGLKMLKDMGCSLEKYHLNEGHTAFLILELFKELKDKEKIRKKCIFTTHTPVPAGHDKFDENLVKELAGEYIDPEAGIFENNTLNMTLLALKFSGYVNGVARKHRKVSRKMFPGYDIESITNGIHARTWTTEPFSQIFEKNIPEWYEDPFSLRAAMNIPEQDVWAAHQKAKQALIEKVKQKTGENLDIEKFTIGFARRFVEYKRPDLIFYDIGKLKSIAEKKGDLQIVFAGKAHPDDSRGKELIKEVFKNKEYLKSSKVKVVFLENYNIETAKLMVSGCDIWLSNPKRPHEASGTSGMKAAINGVPHFSTLDGWWLEGHMENVTGWSIGLHPQDPNFDEDKSPDDEAEDFYYKLENNILPIFYRQKQTWQWMMKACIAINGSFFHTHRMMQQYVIEAYLK